MEWGAVLGGLLGAGGNVAGGLLGSSTGGQGKTSSYNPYLDYALQASQFDLLNSIGFGNINSIPDPYQELIGRIQSAPMDDKTRRRAMTALSLVRQDPTLLADPYGAQFTRDQIFQANKTGAPFGRVVTRGPEGSGATATGAAAGAGAGVYGGPIGMALGAGIGALIGSGKDNDTEPTGLPVKNIGRLENALRSAGITLGDLQDVFKRTEEMKAQRERLNAAGLGKLNEETIINRARANAAANGLIGGAADFASGNAPTGIGLQLQDRDNRALHDLEQRFGLMQQFGGMGAASAVKELTNARLDQQLRLIEQQLGMSTAIQAALNPGQTAASQAAGASTATTMNAAQIAAAQAQAANQLRVQQAQARSGSFANGVGNAFAGLGSTLANQSMMNQLSQYSAGFNQNGPGSTANQLATLFG